MSQKTDVQLKAEADLIANETTTGANSASRIGGTFNDYNDSKINKTDIKMYSIAVSETALPIYFTTPFSIGTYYEILPYCYNSTGAPIGFSITNRSLSGFTVTAAEVGVFIYQIFTL